MEEPPEPSITDILEVIEKNEKLNEVGGREKIIDQGAQLLSFDKKFYSVKKKLVDYNEYTEISNKLYNKKDHHLKGTVSAITVRGNIMILVDRVRLFVCRKLTRDHSRVRYKVTEGDEATKLPLLKFHQTEGL